MPDDNKDRKPQSLTVFGALAEAFDSPGFYDALSESGFFDSVAEATAGADPADTAKKSGEPVPRPV